MGKVSIESLKIKKENNQKIVMVTAYDFPFAKLADQSGVDIILVGDSLANVVLGLESTKEVGMTEMLHHSRAVTRAVENAIVVGDMPFESYQQNIEKCVENAYRFINDAKCDAVKVEWFDDCIEVCKKLIDSGVKVMGHLGLTPQTAERLGGFKVQGKDSDTALKIIEQAKFLESVGCFAVVLECIPAKVAEIITSKLKIPTFGIGAGKYCDGQVLVCHDILGLYDGFRPKFVKQYADLSSIAKNAFKEFCLDVNSSGFPDESHSYNINLEELEKILKEI